MSTTLLKSATKFRNEMIGCSIILFVGTIMMFYLCDYNKLTHEAYGIPAFMIVCIYISITMQMRIKKLKKYLNN